MIKSYGLFFLLGIFLFSCRNNLEKISPNAQYFEYEIKIGEQVWSSNLSFETASSICPQNCEVVGRLYPYKEAIEIEKMLDGWSLPDDEDWSQLEIFVEDKKQRSSNNYKSGADKLKKIKGFNQFPGYTNQSKELIYPSIWGVYWVKGTYTDEELGKIAYTRVLKKEGNKPSMIYKTFMGVDSTNYVSVKLIKDRE